MPWLLTLGSDFATAGSSLLKWLGTLNVWQLALGIALIFAGLEHFELVSARHEAAKFQKLSGDYKRQLDAISTKRDTQKTITKDRIVTVTKTIREADKRAIIVETAPLSGGCKTPSAVLQADL